MFRFSFLFIAASFFISSSFTSPLSSEETNEDFVYLCNKPGQKCYYVIPCQELRETCNKVNGKSFKVPLSRALQMKRKKRWCDSEANN